MKQSDECASLFINTRIVTIAPSGGVLTYVIPINLKNALGYMYDKYNAFKIVLNNYSGFSNYTASNPGNNGMLQISGLIPYPTGMSTLNQTFTMPGVFTVAQNGFSFTNFSATNGIIFKNPSDQIENITFSIIDNKTNSVVSVSGGNECEHIFNFTIYGMAD